MSVRAPLDADVHRVFIALRERLRAGGRFALVQHEASGDYDLRRVVPPHAGTRMLGWVDQSTSQDDIKALMTGRRPARRA